MLAKTLVAAVFTATYVTAGPCKPESLRSTTELITSVEATTSGQTTAQSEGEPTTDSTIIDSLTTTSFVESTQTTEAPSATTSSSPAGDAIILQVNPQRRLAKRDTTFVGNNNPTSCDLATAFHLDDEKFLQDGVPIYYEEGVAYKELASQESQCQNGQIIDQETTSADTTTSVEQTTSDTASQSAGVTTSANVCVAGLNDPNGQPDVESRIQDCSAYNTVTVSPFASTTTLVKRRVYYQIPTAWATPQPKITRRADDPTDTTIFPTEIPSYATYCDSPSEYYEACSEAGVTAFTTTLPEPDTTTTTSTSNGCGPLSKMKRGIEYLGYTLSEDWDRAIFTGVVLHERFHD
ncbi:hypothetical protein ACHAPO_008521 [Fusarium lateritium]